MPSAETVHLELQPGAYAFPAPELGRFTPAVVVKSCRVTKGGPSVTGHELHPVSLSWHSTWGSVAAGG